MLEKCECKNPGFCKRYNCNIGKRHWQYCRGSSGLDRWKEEYLLSSFLEKQKLAPTLLDRLKNFASAVIEHAKDGFSRVSEKDYKERTDICEPCEYCDKSNKVWSCNKCGCYIQIKASWASQDCPIGKWPKIELPMVQTNDTKEKPARGGCCPKG